MSGLLPVIVNWVDSRQIFQSWTLTEGLAEVPSEELEVRSAGWLYEQQDDCIVLVMNVGNDQILGGIAIPRSAVISITYL